MTRAAPAMTPLVIIFLTVFIDLLGFGIIIPLLPFYAESFGGTALTVGLCAWSRSRPNQAVSRILPWACHN